jgi:hypothetical protein
MKRLAILTAVLVVIPIAAMARMSSLSDNAMGVISGKTGITLTWQSRVLDSYIAIYDDNGFTGYGSPGATTLSSFIIDGGTSGTNMSITGLTIDAGTTGATSACQIGLPAITGRVRAGAVRIGTNDNKGGSLGRATFGSINIAPTNMLIVTH